MLLLLLWGWPPLLLLLRHHLLGHPSWCPLPLALHAVAPRLLAHELSPAPRLSLGRAPHHRPLPLPLLLYKLLLLLLLRWLPLPLQHGRRQLRARGHGQRRRGRGVPVRRHLLHYAPAPPHRRQRGRRLLRGRVGAPATPAATAAAGYRRGRAHPVLGGRPAPGHRDHHLHAQRRRLPSLLPRWWLRRRRARRGGRAARGRRLGLFGCCGSWVEGIHTRKLISFNY